MELPPYALPPIQDHDDNSVQPQIHPNTIFIMHGAKLDMAPGFLDVIRHAATDTKVTWLASGDRRLKLGTFTQLDAAVSKHQYAAHNEDSTTITDRLAHIKAEIDAVKASDDTRRVCIIMLFRTPAHVRGQLAKTQLGDKLAQSINASVTAWNLDPATFQLALWIDNADVIHAANNAGLQVFDMAAGVGKLQDMIGVREFVRADSQLHQVQIVITPTDDGTTLLSATIEDPESFYTESSAFKMQSTARKNSDGQLIFQVPYQPYSTSNCRQLVLIGVGAVDAFSMQGDNDEEVRLEPFKITVGSLPVPSEHVPWLVRDGDMLDSSESFMLHAAHMLDTDGLRALTKSQEGRLVRNNLMHALSGSSALSTTGAAAFDTGGGYLARTASTAFGGTPFGAAAAFGVAEAAATALLRRS